MDSDLIASLDALAGRAFGAAESRAPDDVDRAYSELRQAAKDFNARYAWARADEFDVMFPTLGALEEIRVLDGQLSQADEQRVIANDVRQRLRDLGNWLSGIALGRRELGGY